MITFNQFKALDIRIAKIVACEDHPNADKLYVLTVEIGGKTKKAVAGIKQYYKMDELIGKRVVFLDNLEPATIRGTESQGMVLAAKDDKTLALLAPEREVTIGSVVS